MPTTPESESSPSPDSVDLALIAAMQLETQSDYDLYDQLKNTTPEIAFWLRRRAVQLNPDVRERGTESRLALEVAQLLLARTVQGPSMADFVADIEAAFAADTGSEAPAA